jgi:quercetin dioxygenase-like cupin family protein
MYYIVNGSMVVKTKTEEFTLHAGDIGYFAPVEERGIKIVGDGVCAILVAIVKV